MGVRFGECERRLLCEAYTFSDTWFRPGCEYQSGSGLDPNVAKQTVRRATRKLAAIGLIEVKRKHVAGTKYLDMYAPEMNHSFWANYIRLTPLGKQIVDKHKRDICEYYCGGYLYVREL
jgi:hypothetical protein